MSAPVSGEAHILEGVDLWSKVLALAVTIHAENPFGAPFAGQKRLSGAQRPCNLEGQRDFVELDLEVPGN